MPPKKPIVIKLKSVQPVDTAAVIAQCWDSVKHAIDAVFAVCMESAPAVALEQKWKALCNGGTPNGHVSTGGDGDFTLEDMAREAASPSYADPALLSATREVADGTRRGELRIYQRTSGKIQYHGVYQAATDLCRQAPAEMLSRLVALFETSVPRVVEAWLAPVARRLSNSCATNGGGGGSPGGCNSSSGAAAAVGSTEMQACMRLVVTAFELLHAAFRVTADLAAYLDNTYAKVNTAQGGLVGIGTGLFSKLLTTDYQAVFRLACKGFVDAVNDDRQGNVVRRGDLASCRALLLAAGVYHTHVESPLVDAAEKHFTRLGNVLAYTEGASAEDYVRRVDDELASEETRLRSYGHTSCRLRILQVAQERLVKAHIGHVAGKFVPALIQHGQLGAVASLYRLSRLRFVRQEELLRKAFKDYVVKVAQQVLAVDPKMEDTIVDGLVALNATASSVISRCFVVGTTGTDVFTTAKKDAFETSIRPKQQKAAELLAKHLDRILRDGAAALTSSAAHEGADAETSAADAIDAALIDAMKIFAFIPSKDLFEAFYTRYFGKRLILQRSIGIEHERVVIEQLRMVCGPSVALKLNGMLKDMELSKEIQTLFRDTRLVRLSTSNAAAATEQPDGDADDDAGSMQKRTSTMAPELSTIGPADSGLVAADFGRGPNDEAAAPSGTLQVKNFGFDFNVLILTAGYWPTYSVVQPRIPDYIHRQMEVFKVFYLSKYSGRKLDWQHALAHCVVKANFQRSKELVVSFLQAMILLEFNGTDSLRFGELLSRLNLTQSEELTCAIIGLYAGNAKVLLRDKAEDAPPLPKPKPNEPRIVVREEDVLRYNAGFTHRLTKIRVNQVQLKETVEEVQETTEKVMAERHFIVDAAIVRFMKSRKQAKHSELVSEVIGMLRFEVQPQNIKTRIEHLIEREYLERDDADHTLYRYLA